MAQAQAARLLRRLAPALLAGLLGLGAAAAAAQGKPPAWAGLSAEQQGILAPLAGQWDGLDAPSRSRWLGVAKRYPKMTPTGQKRVQSRMAKWAKLTPEQRRQAREKYREMRQREDLRKRWQEYQQLSPQERQKLAAPAKPPRAADKRRGAARPAPLPPPSQ